MTVGFKSPLTSSNVNNAFASKTADNTLAGDQELTGNLDLNAAGKGGQIADTQQQINDNIGDIATNTANIATNTSNISTNTTDISTLEGRSVTGTEGVQRTSGTDLTADVEFKLDINNLTADGTPDGAADFVATYDASAGTHKKVLLDDLPGGGGGSGNPSLDIFHQDNYDTTVAGDFSTGNNATFLGGGSLAGTLTNETTNPLTGTRSIKYTQAAGSLNDYIASPVINIEDKLQGNCISFVLNFTYSGVTSDIDVVIWDETNSTEITTMVSDNITAESSPRRRTFLAQVASNTTQIRYGFKTVVANNGAELIWDDIELTTSLATFKEVTPMTQFGPNGNMTGLATGTAHLLHISTTAPNSADFFDFTAGLTTGTGGSQIWTAQRDGIYNVHFQAGFEAQPTGSNQIYVRKNGTTSAQDVIIGAEQATSGFSILSCSGKVRMVVNDTLRFYVFHSKGSNSSVFGRGWDTFVNITFERDL